MALLTFKDDRGPVATSWHREEVLRLFAGNPAACVIRFPNHDETSHVPIIPEDVKAVDGQPVTHG